MTLTQLEYIIAVAREKNFSRAAQSCHVTQPTLSALIKNLELELGVEIFDRSKNPIKATRLGNLIIEQGKIVLLEAKKILVSLQEERGEIKGELRVGIITTIAPYITPLFIKSFRAKYPMVELSIYETTTSEALLKLNREEIDLAILGTKEHNPKIFQKKIYTEKMLLLINPSDPLFRKNKININMLDTNKIWLLDESHCLRDEVSKYCRIKEDYQNKPFGLNLKAGGLESLRYIVQDNFGYTLFPELATLKFSPKEKENLRSFTAPVPKRDVYFTTSRRVLKKSLIDALEDEISSTISAHLNP